MLGKRCGVDLLAWLTHVLQTTPPRNAACRLLCLYCTYHQAAGLMHTHYDPDCIYFHEQEQTNSIRQTPLVNASNARMERSRQSGA